MPEPCKHLTVTRCIDAKGVWFVCTGCKRRWVPEPAPPREEPTFQGTPLAYGEKLEDGGVSGPRYTVMGAGVAEGREEQPAPPEPEAEADRIWQESEEALPVGSVARGFMQSARIESQMRRRLERDLREIEELTEKSKPAPRCGDCRFAAEQKAPPFGSDEALARPFDRRRVVNCHRYPRSAERPCAWPLVNRDDWCGEFSAKEPSR